MYETLDLKKPTVTLEAIGRATALKRNVENVLITIRYRGEDGATSVSDVIGGLELLLDKNLIRQSEIKGEPRFWMYETIREYGLEILDAAGEGFLIRQRHANYYIVFMNRFSQELNRVETEIDNIRPILRWSIDSGRVELGYRLTNDFWFWGDRASEGRRWLAELLA